jgi:hypothetical protein
MARPRRGKRRRVGGLVREVPVHDAHRDGCAGRHPLRETAGDLRVVTLDLRRSRATAVAALAPPQLDVDPFAVERDTRGEPVDDDRQLGAV